MIRRKLPLMLIFLLLLGAVHRINIVNITGVSAVPTSPYIMVVPEKTVDPTFTPGMLYTVSIYTDYDGNDIWGWQFSLSYNPDILHGGDINTTDTWTGDGVTELFNATRVPVVAYSEKVYVDEVLMARSVNYTIDYSTGTVDFTISPSPGAEVKVIYLGSGVVNGDLITTDKCVNASLLLGQGFDNAIGKLSLVGAFFYYDWTPPPPPYTTTGPGILAKVTFTVVGTGFSSITLGSDTRLKGFEATAQFPYNIIDANTQPAQIGHGYFDNIPNIHDLAVTKLVTPAAANLGDNVTIDVTVRNEGNYTENFDVVVYANDTLIGTQPATLDRGTKTTLRYDWNTTDIATGNYKINATALPLDDDPDDNTMTTTINVKADHDVAVISLVMPVEAMTKSLVTINVTVANQGSFDENVTLTVSYQPKTTNPPPPTVINTTNFTLAKLTASKTVSVSWNTTGLDALSYTINATATIDKDEDIYDNILTKSITIKLGHDVTITSISAPSSVFTGVPVPISVIVKNAGKLNQTFVLVRLTNGTNVIGSQSIALLAGDSETLPFTWDTTGVVPETYHIQAEAILDEDENPADNQRIASIIVKTRTGHIAGVVKDASTGNPIEGANVVADGYFDITDSLGHYNITNIPEGTYTVTASKDGYQTSSLPNISVLLMQTTILNYDLTPIPTTGHVTGYVTDASTGEPIEGATVTANGNSVSTNATGYYSIELSPGTYTVTVSADGHEGSSKSDVNVVAGATTSLDFELMPTKQSDFTLYAVVAAVAIIVIAGIVIYLRKGRKTT